MEPKQGQNGNSHVNNYFLFESFENNVGELFNDARETWKLTTNSIAPICSTSSNDRSDEITRKCKLNFHSLQSITLK